MGLLAATYGSAVFVGILLAVDTRTPLKFAVIRVILTIALGYYCALYLPATLHISRSWGVAGLTASAGMAAWVEFSLLRYALNRRIGQSDWSGAF